MLLAAQSVQRDLSNILMTSFHRDHIIQLGIHAHRYNLELFRHRHLNAID